MGGNSKVVPFDGVVPSPGASVSSPHTSGSPRTPKSDPHSPKLVDYHGGNNASGTNNNLEQIRSQRTHRSLISKMSTLLRDFRFEDPRWMFLPMTSCICLSGLSGVLWWTQGLEEQTNAKIFADPDSAMAEISNPGTIKPCWDYFWTSTCVPQYMSSLYFFILEVLFLVQAWIAYRRWKKFKNERIAEKDSPESSAAVTAGRSRTVDIADRTWEWLLQFSPDGPLFWYRAWASLFTEISMQIIRGFILSDSYARVHATQTILQTVLITAHLDLFAFFYYSQSEVGYVFCNLYSEIAYLMVRVYFHGPMALRATSFLDFLTLAVPLAISACEIQEIVEFIYNSGSMLQKSTEQEHSRRGFWMSILALIATAAGLAICVLVSYLAFIQGCPEIYNSRAQEQRPDHAMTPWSVDCFAWNFNMYLSPACSCVYLVLHPVLSTDCAGMGSNDHKMIEHLKPHLESVRFFTMGQIMSEACQVTDRDLELISSWTELRFLHFNEFSFTTVPQSFENLKKLTHFMMRQSWLEKVDVSLGASWTKLEAFSCELCPHLDNLNFLTANDLPRLNHVAAHGIGSCPRDWLVSFEYLEQDIADFHNMGSSNSHYYSSEEASEFKCSPRLRSERCEGMPDWLAISLLEGMREGAHLNSCSTVLCSEGFNTYTQMDFNRNFLFDASEYGHFLQLRYLAVNFPNYEALAQLYTAETHQCFVDLFSSLFSQYHTEPDDGVDVSSGITFLQYLAWSTQYSTCAECDFIADAFQQRKMIYENVQLVDQDDACAGILTANQDPRAFSATCTMDVADMDCHQGLCPLGLDYAAPHDTDKDLIFNASEIVAAGLAAGQDQVYDEKFLSCLQQAAPECIDAEVDGQPAMKFHTFLRVAFHVMKVGNCPDCGYVIDCTKCDLSGRGYS